MPYILKMQPPKGPAEYLPPSFGFDNHEHATDPAEAARFPDTAAATRRGNTYRYPPAFWDCERRHRDLMEKRFRGWVFSAEPVAQ